MLASAEADLIRSGSLRSCSQSSDIIHDRSRTPISSILRTIVLSVAICAYAAASFRVTSITTITLYLAYGIPIFLLLRNRLSGKGPTLDKGEAPWTMGRIGKVVNVIAVVWVAIITVVFCLPPNELVLWSMVVLGVLLAAGWLLRARRNFVGPGKEALAAMDET